LISGCKNEPKTFESQLEKVKELTGVEVPKYYNPHAINPLKYAEQIKKRQMLWSKKESSSDTPSETVPNVNSPSSFSSSSSAVAPIPSSQALASSPSSSSGGATSFNKWESTNFGNDKTNEKFRRLMGIKGGSGSASSSSGSLPTEVPPPGQPQRPQKWFEDQEQQYERARAITHTQRGLGLGFGSAVPPASAPPSTETTEGFSMEKKPLSFVKK